MSRQGHSLPPLPNRQQSIKMTYAELQQYNMNLIQENKLLQDIERRLGIELEKIHKTLDIQGDSDTEGLLDTMTRHPYLCEVQHVLMPLLTAYDSRILTFSADFENLYNQYVTLEKLYQSAVIQNGSLRKELVTKTEQIINLYRNGAEGSGEYSLLLRQQAADKQRSLFDKTNQLEQQYSKISANHQRTQQALIDAEKKLQAVTRKLKETDINARQSAAEVVSLKALSLSAQAQANKSETQRKKMEQALERAQSQVGLLTKERDTLAIKLQDLRLKFERSTSNAQGDDQSRTIEELKTEIQLLRADGSLSQFQKKIAKLQKELESTVRQNTNLKETVDRSRLKETQQNSLLDSYKTELSQLRTLAIELEIKASKAEKLQEQTTLKVKQEIAQFRNDFSTSTKQSETKLAQKVQEKTRRIQELEQQCERRDIELSSLKRELEMFKEGPANKTIKLGGQRDAEKLREKLKISQDVFSQQLKVAQSEGSYLKKELQACQSQLATSREQLRQMKRQQQATSQSNQETQEKYRLATEEARRIRADIEKFKVQREGEFENKLNELRLVIEETELRRKSGREKAQEAVRSFKKAQQEMRATYEDRIRTLENERQVPVSDRLLNTNPMLQMEINVYNTMNLQPSGISGALTPNAASQSIVQRPNRFRKLLKTQASDLQSSYEAKKRTIDQTTTSFVRDASSPSVRIHKVVSQLEDYEIIKPSKVNNHPPVRRPVKRNKQKQTALTCLAQIELAHSVQLSQIEVELSQVLAQKMIASGLGLMGLVFKRHLRQEFRIICEEGKIFRQM